MKKPSQSGGFFFYTHSLYIRSIINHKSIKMNFFTNSIKVFLLSFLLAACDNSGGVWLGEGESKGKSYTFGNQTEIETLHNLASAYSEKNPEKLSYYYPLLF